MTISVAVCGAAGRMGRETIKTIVGAHDLALIGGISPHHAGADCGTLAGLGHLDIPVVERLADLPNLPDVVVDFTRPETVKPNVLTALAAGIRPVVGTSGLFHSDVAEIAQLASDRHLGTIVAPNFAIGAILLLRFATEAARFFEHAEIIELHHHLKADAPSGTAIKTAEAMLGVRASFGASTAACETYCPARGADFEGSGLHIHSVRLPGLLAHQEVIFGSPGQTLTLRHDSLSRESFMPGVLLAIRKVVALDELVYGLEQLI